MSAFAKSYKVRVNKKLEDVLNEVHSFCGLLEAKTVELKQQANCLREDGRDFFSEYKKLMEDVDHFSEKLFLASNIICSSSSEEALLIATNTCGDSVATTEGNYDTRRKEQECSNVRNLSVTPQCENKIVAKNSSTGVASHLDPGIDVESHLGESGTNMRNVNSTAEEINRSQTVADSRHPDCKPDLGSHVKVSASSSHMSSNLCTSFDSSYYSETLHSHSLPCDVTAKNEADENKRSGQSSSSLDYYASSCSFQSSSSRHCSSEGIKASEMRRSASVGDIPLPEVIVGSQFSTVVTNFQTPCDFWIQLENPEKVEFSCRIQNSTDKIDFSVFKTQKYCLSPFKRTGFYRRAKVLNAVESGYDTIVQVLFIDYGSVETVYGSELQLLPESLLSYPSQAIHCFLSGIVPCEDNWSEIALQKFQDFSEYSDLQALILYKQDDMFAVELTVTLHLPEEIETCNIAQMLCLYDLARPIEDCPEKSADAPESCAKPATQSEVPHLCNQDSIAFEEAQSSVDRKYARRNVALETFYLNSACNNTVSCNPISGNSFRERHQVNSVDIDKNLCRQPTDGYDQKRKKYSDPNRNHSSYVTEEYVDDICRNNEYTNLDWNAVVHKSRPVFIKPNFMLVNASAVENPRSFFVHVMSERIVELDDLREQMTAFYGCLNYDVSSSLGKLKVGTFCSCRYLEDCCWYRAKIMEMGDSECCAQSEVLVEYIDYGNKRVVDVQHLRPLTANFAVHPAFAVQCSLAYVIPKSSSEQRSVRENEVAQWDEKAVIMMKELLTTSEKFFTAQIVRKRRLSNSRSVYDVALWDSQDGEDILINDILINEGVVAADPSAFCHNISPTDNVKPVDNVLDHWNPMMDDYVSILNSYGVDVGNAEVAVNGYRASDEKYICKYFSNNGRCYRGDDCPYEHVDVGCDTETRDQVDVILVENPVALPEPGIHCLVQVSHVINPGHFYIQFPFGICSVSEFARDDSEVQKNRPKELQLLYSAMNEYYSTAPFDENTAIAPACGNLVAAKSCFDGRWYRGRIVDVTDVDTPVEVFSIDFGGKEWISRRYIREIKQEYLHCPFQAVECFLSNVSPKDGTKWSEQACQEFCDIVKECVLLAQIDKKIGSVLYVTLQRTSRDNKVIVNNHLVNTGHAHYAKFDDIMCSRVPYFISEELQHGNSVDYSSVLQPG